MAVKSCAAAEDMTQPESPVSPSVSANSTGAVLSGARSAETLWMSTHARPPRRQNGWTRPEHINTSLFLYFKPPDLKAQDLCMHTSLHPQPWAAILSLYLRIWRVIQRDFGVLAGSLALGRS